MTKTFYQLADELHTELVRYYGGEAELLFAVHKDGIDQLAEALASFTNQELAIAELQHALIGTFETAVSYGVTCGKLKYYQPRLKNFLDRIVAIDK